MVSIRIGHFDQWSRMDLNAWRPGVWGWVSDLSFLPLGWMLNTWSIQLVICPDDWRLSRPQSWMNITRGYPLHSNPPTSTDSAVGLASGKDGKGRWRHESRWSLNRTHYFIFPADSSHWGESRMSILSSFVEYLAYHGFLWMTQALFWAPATSMYWKSFRHIAIVPLPADFIDISGKFNTIWDDRPTWPATIRSGAIATWKA